MRLFYGVLMQTSFPAITGITDASNVRVALVQGTQIVSAPALGIGLQPLDATLTALAGLNSTAGLVVQTGADAFTKRTLTGTANKITVTNGDGVSGNPTVTIPDVVVLVSPEVTGVTTLTGGRIGFPPTQIPSADPNTLDDYEEGTSSPTVTASSGTFTTVSATLSYTKVGREVMWSASIVITTAGTATGILNLPVPFTNGSLVSPISGVSTTGEGLAGAVEATSSTANIVKYNGTTCIASGVTIKVGGTYRV